MKGKVKQELKELIVSTGVEMIKTGITVGTWGNISYRDPETDYMYISPSGMDYMKVKTDHVVVMDLDLNIIEGEAEPSIEKHMHVAVYKARPDAHAVIHTHPTFSTIFGVAGLPLPAVSEDFVQIVGEEIAIASPYALPGTPELGEVAVKGLGKNGAVLLPGHGALIAAANMPMALKISTVLEKNAQIYLYAKLLGNGIRLFSREEIDAMQNFAKNHYGKKNQELV